MLTSAPELLGAQNIGDVISTILLKPPFRMGNGDTGQTSLFKLVQNAAPRLDASDGPQGEGHSLRGRSGPHLRLLQGIRWESGGLGARPLIVLQKLLDPVGDVLLRLL